MEVLGGTRLLPVVGCTKFPCLQLVLQPAPFSLVRAPCPGGGGRMALLESGSFPTLVIVSYSSHFSLFWKLCFIQSQQAKVQLLACRRYSECVTPLSADPTQRARPSEMSPREGSSRKGHALTCICSNVVTF